MGVAPSLVLLFSLRAVGQNLTEDSDNANESTDFNVTNLTKAPLPACPARVPRLVPQSSTAIWDPGPASLEDRARADWLHGTERQRFAALGAAGPPTRASRELSQSLARGLGCLICHQLLRSLWGELLRPTAANIRSWIQQGCPVLVKQLLREGWAASTGPQCAAGGTSAVDGEAWCFLQDTMSDVVAEPELAERYDPAADSMMLACEDTIAYHRERVIWYLTNHSHVAPDRSRHETLMRSACVEAACCELL